MIFSKLLTMAFVAISAVYAVPVEVEPVLPDLPDSAYALNPKVPSVEEFVELLDGDPSKLDARSLERRQWVTDNNFRFYLRWFDQTFCGPDLVGCGGTSSQQIIKRDNCK
ncbi:hypothetical protein ABW20_dc0104633 [Dactylellina cionopaga]|nr:hypothetical protein ABW20_dc0104633 [Dactylellina cionopaga]